MDFTYLIWATWANCVSKSVIKAQSTYHVFFMILAWSLQALWEGKWPKKDWKGVPYKRGSLEHTLAHENGGWLADGLFGCLWVQQGDLDHYYKTLGLENYNSVTSPCALCPCNLTTMNWRDFRPGAL